MAGPETRVPIVIVDPMDASSECPRCDSKELEEIGRRRLRCPRCDFEANRDVIGKLNIRKSSEKAKPFWGALAPLPASHMADVNPNRWGEPMSSP